MTLEQEEKARIVPKSKVGEGETWNYNTTKCPYCKSSAIEGGVIYQAKTEKERQQIGYRAKRQHQCLECMAKWISMEK